MFGGADASTVPKCVWTNLQGEYIDLGKSSIVYYHCVTLELPWRPAHVSSVPTHGDKNHKKKKGRKWKTCSEGSRKDEDRNLLIKAVSDKKGVTSMKLAAKIKVDIPCSICASWSNCRSSCSHRSVKMVKRRH